jgi:hypothetical protein
MLAFPGLEVPCAEAYGDVVGQNVDQMPTPGAETKTSGESTFDKDAGESN